MATQAKPLSSSPAKGRPATACTSSPAAGRRGRNRPRPSAAKRTSGVLTLASSARITRRQTERHHDQRDQDCVNRPDSTIARPRR